MEPPAQPRGFALHAQILAGLAVGAGTGLAANALWPGHPRLLDLAESWAKPAGQIFLRLIFMVVIPLVFSALVLGVTGLGDVRRLGRVGLRTLLFTVILSGTSVLIGLGLANAARPGDRLPAEQRRELREKYPPRSPERAAKPFLVILRDLVPENPLKEMTGALDGSSPGGGMLAVMVFAVMVGVAISVAPARTGALVAVLEGLYDVSMTVVGWAMRLAPFGVAALVFSLTAVLGLDILKTLAFYMAVVLAGLALHLFGVYSIGVALFARLGPRKFFSGSAEAMLTAFGTSSSNATLPVSIKVAEQRLGVSREITRFVLTAGASANQNGTALYEGITVLFLAQVFGVELTLAQQATVLLMCVMAGIGTAGVPGGSLPLVGAVLATLGIPAEGIAVILGVDRLLDMCRTVVNVTGDLAVAVCVDRAERPRSSST
jgi:DAACS family dicarboxylate/amino acid:cation (Na+ or H+) symporter